MLLPKDLSDYNFRDEPLIEDQGKEQEVHKIH